VLVSVTPLGIRRGTPADAAARVVNYVESKVQAGRRLAPSSPEAVGGYYADSVEGPGRWVGGGSDALGLSGQVAPEHLERVLVGEHPGTGDTLRSPFTLSRLDARSPTGEGSGDVLTLAEAAQLVGMTARALRYAAVDTERQTASSTSTDVRPGRQRKASLHATRSNNGAWEVRRDELERFAAERRPRKAVIGYDVTFSAPKSVSILWAVADERTQREIAEAVECAVDAGLRYLESVTSTRAPTRPVLQGLVAAAFLHGTSRNLDPQLHVHAVVANLALQPDDECRALDGRDLFAHAKTAGYLAAAHLRHVCTQRFGWSWGPVIHGLADVEGVPADAIRAMSSRRQEIESLATETGIHSAPARQVAAYQTRTAKAAVAPDALRDEWDQRLIEAGFDRDARDRCLSPGVALSPLGDAERGALLAGLASAHGVTERSAVFDRRDVIQTVASWSVARLSASEILDLADEFLASEQAIPLARADKDVIRLRGGRVAPTARGLTRYSTPAMLAAERQVLDAFDHGIDRDIGIVTPDLVETAIAARPSLGDDQAAMVRAICTSGDQFQCVLGPAGSGKTFALDAARDAWQRAGYHVIGAADQGTAAEVLALGTGIRAETLEYWLTLLDTHPDPNSVLDARTVLLVDEASTVGTCSLARLCGHAQRTGAVVRLVGDPAQHTAVAAGGAFADLIARHPDRTPELTELRRQASPELAQLRLALREYRDGLIAQSIDRLDRDHRVVLADNAEQLLDQLATDWWADRQRRHADPSHAPSSMVAEHHRERRALNTRARILLATNGDLHGPAFHAGAHEFRAGDEVICRAPAKQLHPAGQPERYLRNGTRGTVTAVDPDGPQPGIVVDFEHRGPIRVPAEFLTRELRPGIHGGLTYSYALTSHAAQGHTHHAARTLTTDSSSRPGIYVGLTRGQADSRLYAVRRRDLVADPDAEDHLPRLTDDKTTLEAVTDRLITTDREHLATTDDPTATQVAQLRDAHPLAELVDLHETAASDDDRTLIERAIAARRLSLARAARLDPPPELVARIGPRPDVHHQQRVWDMAVGAVAVRLELDGVEGCTLRAFRLPDTRRVHRLLRRAETAHLTSFPTDELADEVIALTNDLTTASRASLLRRRQVVDALARATLDIEHTERQQTSLDAQGHRNARTRPRIANADLAAELARARAHHDRLAQRLALIDEDPAAHTPLVERLERLRAALDHQVRRAVEQARTNPPRYTTDLMGPRPTGEAGVSWDRRVHLLETFRHHHGLAPSDDAGATDAGPAEYALGPRPPTSAAAMAWDHTLDAITAPSSALEPTPALRL
jgi:conjugative relaxase-like TrwC/TraI family protein